MLITFWFMCGIQINGRAHSLNDITGPTLVLSGSTHTYDYYSGLIVNWPKWEVSGGTIIASTDYTVTIQWSGVGSGQVVYKSRHITLETLNITISSPPTAPNNLTYSRCGAGTMVLSASGAPSGGTYKWYSSSSGGSILHTGGNYTTPHLTSNHTYWVSAVNNLGIESTSRAECDVVIHEIPTPPTIIDPAVRCAPTTFTIQADASPHGLINYTYKWYYQSTGGTPFFTSSMSNTYTTPLISGSKTYYVSRASAACESEREGVTVEVKQVPDVSSGQDGVVYLAGDVARLTISAVSGATHYDWYDTESAENSIHQGLYYDVNVNDNKSYYVRARNSTTGCESQNPLEVKQWLYLVPHITRSDGRDNFIGAGESATIEVNDSYDVYQWYRDGMAVGGSMAAITVNLPGTYTVACWFSGNPGRKVYASMPYEVLPKPVWDENEREYKQQTTILKEGVKTLSQLANLPVGDHSTSYLYYDDGGRVIQKVTEAISPLGHDRVQPFVYSDFGREIRHYLPYVSTDNDGSFKETPIADQNAFYQQNGDGIANDNYPYFEEAYEESPLPRIVAQGNVGSLWQLGGNHTIRTSTRLNSSVDEPVRKWDANGTSTSTYKPGELYVQVQTNEENKTHKVYIDNRGRTILKRAPQSMDTYYIYDELNQLVMIIPPKALELMGSNYSVANTAEELVYSFNYDDRGRLIMRKIPGKGEEYIIYDQWNRVLLTQNVLLRTDRKWRFVKYDRLQRPIMAGLYEDETHLTRTAMQNFVNTLDYSENGSDQYYETRESSSTYGYSTNKSFPVNNIELLTVNYYDDYDIDNDGQADYQYDAGDMAGEAEPAADMRTQGKTTSVKMRVLGSNDWLSAAFFYDDHGNVIQTVHNNPVNFLVEDKSTFVYDWSGQLIKSKSTHVGYETVIVVKEYEYDHAGRLMKTYHTINGGQRQLLRANSYNELGQLIEKNVHQQGSGFLQSTDLSYTIRGWLDTINNTNLVEEDANNGPDYFGMELLYADAPQAKYDGGIGQMKWKQFGEAQVRDYGLTYDENNRLTASTFNLNGVNTHSYDMAVSYDANGNIKTMDRKSAGTQIDELTYTYQGNQLLAVTDEGDSEGFEDGNTIGSDYHYDSSGNLTSDKNKGIDSIVYNFMDLPEAITFSDGHRILNTYDASGNRLRQQLTDTDGISVLSKTDYSGICQYINEELSFVYQQEGRLVPVRDSQGMITDFAYQYQLTDHLGNVRVMFTSDPAIVHFNATMESDTIEQADDALFLNINDNPVDMAATSYDQVQRLWPGTVDGAAISLPVYPGDTLEMSVQGFYRNGDGSSTTSLNALITATARAFGGVNGGTSGEQTLYDAFEATYDPSLGGVGVQQPPTGYVAAYLNYIIFDKNFNAMQQGFVPLDDDANGMAMEVSIPGQVVQQEGFVYVYLTNESNAEVYFDDFEVAVKESRIVQATDYYPFGLQHNASWTRPTALKNKYLFNGGSELNEATDLYETLYRNYDPALGRFNGIDIYASAYHSLTPYQFAGNNPVSHNDPNGDRISWERMQWEQETSEVFRRSGGGLVSHFPSMFGIGQGGGYEVYGRWYGGAVGVGLGPGSGNHWSDQLYMSMGAAGFERNAAMMSSSTLDAMYGISGMSDQDKASFAAGIGDPGYLVTTDNGTYLYADKSFQSDFAGGGLSNWYRAVDMGAQSGGNDPLGLMADLLRNVPYFGINNPNPFYGAEAIYADAGWSFVGAEGDAGGFFILAGKDKGKFVSFTEIAGGAASDAGLGFEIGRVDVTGNPDKFTSEYLFGVRDKVWGAVSPTGEIISIGGGYSWGTAFGQSVTAKSLQFGIGVSPIPFILGGGYNHGRIKK